MDPTTDPSAVDPSVQPSPDLGAWVLARAGYALDAAVDRTVNGPQAMTDPSQAYGVGPNGTLYRIGQPSGQVVASVGGASAVTGGIPPVLILALVGLLLIHHA